MRTIYWRDGFVFTVDQTKLPGRLSFIKLQNYEEVADAVKKMRIRGAPLIGVAGALGLALTAFHSRASSRRQLMKELKIAKTALLNTRPTGFNLTWALNRVMRKVSSVRDNVEKIKNTVISEALTVMEEDVKTNLLIARKGARLLEDGDVVLTHCNPGAFGTVEYGTALGIIKIAFKSGKRVKVIATETRPQLQGARLTTFELKREGIPVVLITDGMVGHVMSQGIVNKVIVGADRILRTGHVINKIGTYTIAVLAKAHNVPFYVAAPQSTIDFKTNPEDVIIEERDPNEVLTVLGRRVAPRGIPVLNPAFDVTPPELISAIITEKGIFTSKNLRKINN